MDMTYHNIDLSTESGHQQAVILWSEQESVRRKYPELRLLHHIPNGGERNKIVAARLKQQGVKSGVPDLHLPVARAGYHSLYIEMKKPGGTLSSNQKWWIEQLRNEGNLVVVCYGWEAAVATLTAYLEAKEAGK